MPNKAVFDIFNKEYKLHDYDIIIETSHYIFWVIIVF